jgi:hypothetical protein
MGMQKNKNIEHLTHNATEQQYEHTSNSRQKQRTIPKPNTKNQK